MTSQPRNLGCAQDAEEDEEGAFEKMPFDAAHALATLAWHEAWLAALERAASKLEPGQLSVDEEVLQKRRDGHKKLAKSAREAWSLLGKRWASVPRGEKDGAEVAKALQDLARASAEHCAAMRLYKEQSGAPLSKLQADAVEPWERFQKAQAVLKSKKGVLRRVLVERAIELLWATSWHAANTVASCVDEPEEPEEDDGGDDDEEGDEEENDDDDEDEEAPFGEDYPGSSDDAVEDMEGLLSKLSELFCDDSQWRGVRLDMSTIELGDAEAAMDAIAHVPGAFGESGLNSVRLVIQDLAGSKDPLGSDLRSLLVKADGLKLRVLLEVPAVPGKRHETWLSALATAAAPAQCVRGVALPKVEEPLKATGLLRALRGGGLSQERCTCFFQIPGRNAVDAEGEWTEQYSELRTSSLEETDAAALPIWLADGHVMPEGPAVLPEEEELLPSSAQELLDAASMLGERCQHLSLVSSWSLAVPGGTISKLGSKAKSSESPLPKELYQEFAQRLIASVQEAERGWFFESWKVPSTDDRGEKGLQGCLEKGWVDLSAEEQVMHPQGGSHKASLIYLHGFTCDGYSYLLEPHYFYRPKPKKKKGVKAKKANRNRGDDGDEDVDLEPFPGLKVILPSAPKRHITCYQGELTPAWHDYLTDYEGDQEDAVPPEDLEEVTSRIHALLDAEVAAVGARNVFLGGASQGCGMALHAGLTYPGELGALVGTMGHVLSSSPVTAEWAAKKIPVFAYVGQDDSLMPWEKWVKATYQRLLDAGVEVHTEVTEGVDHAEHEDVWLRSFLTEILRPASVKAAAKKKR